MNDSADHRVAELDARDNRRWLIGVCISVAFGLFGVVMALLSYSHRTSTASGTPATHRSSATTPPRAPAASTPGDAGDRERRLRRHQR
jgi:hypothetical protein